MFPGGYMSLASILGLLSITQRNTSIHGELLELPSDKAILDALDRHEEFDPSRPQKSLFIRKKAKIKLANGRNVEGWMYVYNRNPGNAPIIRGGNYSKSKVA